MKPKQKSVTMWAIWSPYSGFIPYTLNTTRKDAWDAYTVGFENQKDAKKEGYRAVKGTFTWSDK